MPKLDSILKPRTVAVVGASRTPNSIGYQVVANLVQFGFTGAVYPVNPKAHAIHSIRAWPSVSDIPEPVDLAVVVVPKDYVQQVAEQCAESGVKGLVIISAGFRETGAEGAERERRLMDLVRENGMRMVGPNCMGVLNAAPDYAMNATFAPTMPPFGQVGFVSQSGAMGLSVLDYAKEYGIGISQFVSMGNKPDVSGNDLLLQWEDDPSVEIILMYVESFGNPTHFRQIASRITRNKPIIIVKAGRSEVGARAATSHTGSLAEGDAEAEALMQQAGVLRATSVEELFDLAMGFTGGRLPKGRRVAVLTNSGGPGILTADALELSGLSVPELEPQTVAKLAPLFPAEASIRNPLDMIASATPEGYRAALDSLLSDDKIDAAVVIFVPPLGVQQEDVARAIVEVGQKNPDTPVLTVLMGREGLPQGKAQLHHAGIPAFIFPESATRALTAMARYRELRDRKPLAAPDFEFDHQTATAIIDRATKSGLTKLSEPDTLELLTAYGLRVARARLAGSAEEAEELAATFDGPAVLKVVSQQIVHKSDVGGVVVGVRGPGAVAQAFDDIVARVSSARPDARIDGVMVQELALRGREVIVGMSRGRAGPLMMFGLGGVFVEALRDVVFRLAPLSADDARDMVHGIRGTPILDGVRGDPPVDFEALEEALLRVSRLALDFPQITELDVNPLLAYPSGAIAVDGRVMIGSEGK